jgi:hypothetical protein
MSKTSKIVLWIVILVVIVGGVWFALSRNKGGQQAMVSPAQPTTPVTTQNQNPATPQTPSVAPSATQTTSPTDTSNAALGQDLTNIDSQINGLNSDSANVDQSLSQQSNN